MSDNDSEINNQTSNLDSYEIEKIKLSNDTDLINQDSKLNSSPKWINNKGEEVKQVFGFNENAELVNRRAGKSSHLGIA